MLSASNLYGQTGCPGCMIDLPAGLPADTVYLAEAETGFQNLAFESNVSFRLPLSTTPVNILDPSVPAGLPVDRITINGLSNLPAGLDWELNQRNFTPADQPDGCVLLCGVPEETGYFLVEVNLTAVVFGIQQNSAFTFPLQIYPEPSADEPVELFGNLGCDSLSITIVNNIKSNGMPGFQYSWDFGNGMVDSLEFPGNITYDEPGTYLVDFSAVIDTAGYTLSALQVVEAGCSDFGIPPIFSGNPDLYVLLKDTSGNEIFRSDILNDASVPASFSLSFELNEPIYTLEVWDNDSGLAGGDDLCGRVVLDRLSGDTLVDNNLKVLPVIFHPVIEVEDQDTVVVFSSPEPANLQPDLLQLNCLDSLFIHSDINRSLSWYRDGNFLEEADSLFADMAGLYWAVRWDSMQLCFSQTDTVVVEDPDFPPTPFFINDNNLLVIADSLEFGDNVIVQWYLNETLLESSNSFSWCATESGLYEVSVLDTTNGCSSFFEVNIAYNPNYDCLSGVKEAEFESSLVLFPNPATNYLQIKGNNFIASYRVSVFDYSGKQVMNFKDFKHGGQIDVSILVPGIYIVLVNAGAKSYQGRFIKQ